MCTTVAVYSKQLITYSTCGIPRDMQVVYTVQTFEMQWMRAKAVIGAASTIVYFFVFVLRSGM